MPRFSFEYFLQRCRRLGEHKFTQVKILFYNNYIGIYDKSTSYS